MMQLIIFNQFFQEKKIALKHLKKKQFVFNQKKRKFFKNQI